MSAKKHTVPEWVDAMLAALDISVERVQAKLAAEQERLGVNELPVAQVLNILSGLMPSGEAIRAKFMSQVAPELAKLARTGKSRVEPDDAALG